MSERKIVPIGGSHKSATSLLAEFMSDPATKRVVVFAFDGEGDMTFGHFGVTRMEMAYTSVIGAQQASEGDWE